MAIDIERVAVLGAGTVGASWILYFLARGLEVSAYDVDAAREAYVRDYVSRGWITMRRLMPELPPVAPPWHFYPTIERAIAGVQYVQESAPDKMAIKRALFQELDGCLPAEVVVGSSTSSLLISELQAGLTRPARFVVAHPFNPPHLIPVVEIVGGRLTSPEVVEQACTFFSSLGKTVLRLKKEIRGHLVNRLQAALFQEAVWLVREGVADVADVDRGIALGPGLRWATAGPFLTFHLGADAGGIRSYLHHLGSAHERMWDDLHRVARIDAEVVERIARGVDAEIQGTSVEELAARRDKALVDLLMLMPSSLV